MYDATGRGCPAQAEQRLLLAVLDDAVTIFDKGLLATDRRSRRLLREVELWFASDDGEWVFSFAYICDVLGFDKSYLRAGLRRRKAGFLPAVERRPTVPQFRLRRMEGIGRRAVPLGRGL